MSLNAIYANFVLVAVFSNYIYCGDVDVPRTETSAVSFNYKSKFTVEELMSTTFPHSISDDVNLDPCKSGTFGMILTYWSLKTRKHEQF